MKNPGNLIKGIVILSCLFISNIFAQKAETIAPPSWSKNQAIYEVNLRQYTKSGSIKEFMSKLPKLKEMGVGILWLMPIHPIGVEHRKGTYGSYYSVRDYYGLDSMLGTKADFKKLVKQVHKMGMHIIIDWVANHTAWDNVLTKEHPEYYNHNAKGEFIAPVPDWTDVIDLNYDNKDLWEYMTKALEYWVKEFDIDGYRCDVAGMVPTEFWQFARPRLQKIKPVFMLAEWEDPKLHEKAFDMTYSWDLLHTNIDVAQGKKPAYAIIRLMEKELKSYPANAYRMRFTTNHDENSWNGTSNERLGKAVDAYNVICATLPGMFLVYSGQEAGEPKRLDFFEKDVIAWKSHPNFTLFKNLIHLKKENKALWNGTAGGEFIPLVTDTTSSVISYLRDAGKQAIIVSANLSGTAQQVTLKNEKIQGEFKDFTTGKVVAPADMKFTLQPYEYKILVK